MNDISDAFPLTNDLLKPWSMPALVLTALLLMGAAAWSYLRAPGGKRTDTASLLRFLLDKYKGERYLRGLVILSDGADNVASDPPARSLAARFRNLPCPVYTIAFGSKSTAAKENDIVLTSAVAEPSLVPAKGKVSVRALIDSLGRIGDTVRVAVLLNDKEVAAQITTLQLRKKNEVQISFD